MWDSDDAGVRPAMWLSLEPSCQHLRLARQGPLHYNEQVSDVPAFVFSNLEAGDIIEFGNHFVPWRNDFETITWRVFDVQDNRAFLITEYVALMRDYHYDFVDVTWEDSEIRRWLNLVFYHRFSEHERTQIAETYVINLDNQWFGTPGGNNTTDKIFLPSIEEVVRYFGDSGQLANRPAHATAISDRYNHARLAEIAQGGWNPTWLLRSPGARQNMVATVSGGADGSISLDGWPVMYLDGVGMRPAMWICLGE